MSRRRFFTVALVLGALIGGCGRAKEAAKDSTQAGTSSGSVPVRFTHAVTPFTFTDQTGRAFGLKDLLGKVWVVDVIFTYCSGPCPDMTAAMKALQQETSDLADLHLVTLTVDPKRDTVEALARYAKEQNADPARWHFLRGDEEATAKLLTEGFRFRAESNEPLTHETKFGLIDRQGRLRSLYDLREEGDRSRLLADARKLLIEGTL